MLSMPCVFVVEVLSMLSCFFAVVFCCCFSYRMRKVEKNGCMKLMLVKTSEDSGGGGGGGLYSRGWWGALFLGVPSLYESI